MTDSKTNCRIVRQKPMMVKLTIPNIIILMLLFPLVTGLSHIEARNFGYGQLSDSKNTSSFNEFMIHQPGRFYMLIEVDKDSRRGIILSPTLF